MLQFRLQIFAIVFDDWNRLHRFYQPSPEEFNLADLFYFGQVLCAQTEALRTGPSMENDLEDNQRKASELDTSAGPVPQRPALDP